MNHQKRTVDLVANLAIIAVAALVCIAGAKRFLGTGNDLAAIHQVAPGARVSLPGVDWHKNGQSLLLVLSPDCHFCTESAPFYQRLVKQTEQDTSVRVVGVFPEQVNGSQKYLENLGVNLPDLRKSSFAQLGISGTPTLLLVDQNGIVSKVWVGKLKPEGEAEVLSQIKRRS